MVDSNFSLIKKIWGKNIVGREVEDNDSDIKSYLYHSFISRNKEIIRYLDIDIPDTSGLQFLHDIVNRFSKINTNHLGFFPVGILKSKSLTCAGVAMLVNTILKEKGYEVKYARPISHSVNIVNFDDNYYWVDGANSVIAKIQLRIKEMKGFSVGFIESDNLKIDYKIATILNSKDIIVNVFGNIEALKARKSTDKLIDEYLSQNQEIYEVDFNSYLENLYQNYFDYIRFDIEFNKERNRVENRLLL